MKEFEFSDKSREIIQNEVNAVYDGVTVHFDADKKEMWFTHGDKNTQRFSKRHWGYGIKRKWIDDLVGVTSNDS